MSTTEVESAARAAMQSMMDAAIATGNCVLPSVATSETVRWITQDAAEGFLCALEEWLTGYRTRAELANSLTNALMLSAAAGYAVGTESACDALSSVIVDE